VIYKLELQGKIQEYSAFPNLWSVIDDLTERNEAAGRQVIVNSRAKDKIQFTLVYPKIDRKIDGTVSVYAKGVKVPVFAEDIFEDVERLMQEGKLRDEICRLLSCSVRVYRQSKVLLRRRDLERQKATQERYHGI
jgi:hypothetical protein